MAINVLIGGKVAEMRELRGMSRAQLALRVGCREDAIAALEAGGHVRPSLLAQISTALQISLSAFFVFDVAPALADDPTPPSPAEGLAMAKLFFRIRNRRYRAVLLDIADYLVSDDDG